MRTILIGLALLAFFGPRPAAAQTAQSQILDPAVHGLKRLEPLTLGSEQDNTHMKPKEYRLEVG